MSMMEYWPSRKNIVQCIRNEAEELEDHVLLAVHEPMLLTRCDVNENHEYYVTKTCSSSYFIRSAPSH
jgi:hypothetical protein